MATDRSDALKDRLAAVEGEAADTQATKPPHIPGGWSPGVTWDGGTKQGTVTTGPMEEPPSDWDPILRHYGLDPDLFEIVNDTVKFTAWDGWGRDEQGDDATSRVQYAFKADVRLKAENEVTVDVEALYAEVRKAKRPAVADKEPGEDTLLVALSDWQVGNADGGGVEAQVRAIEALTESIPNHVKNLRKMGHDIGTVCLAGMGDMGENTCNFYEYQEFVTQADRREQQKLIRRGLRDIIMEVAKVVPRVLVTAVPGNHGENRQTGMARFNTTKGDNDDVAVFEQVAEILAMNPDAYGHVGWTLPLEEQAVSVRLSGQTVAFVHGHLARQSGRPVDKMWSWWEKQQMGRHYPGVADADILVVGHYHHLNAKREERTLFICPSLTKVGDYYGDSFGSVARPGTLTFVVTPEGWNTLHVL